MDFPLFHLDYIGNRMLIAVVAVTHVLINHALAVGAMPLITLLEWWGYKTGNQAWDRLAYKLLGFCFVITTTVGALTGVGIWFSASLVNPASIGSLIRVFFWGWFIEWIVFVTEVSLIVAYFMLWKKWQGEKKKRHIALGVTLSASSWATMAIIVAILGFMMEPGETWETSRSFLTAVFNPIYLPQLCFRTPLAMVGAGLMMMSLTPFFTPRGDAFRGQAIRMASIWTLAWTPLLIVGSIWYHAVIPTAMEHNVSTALTTQNWVQYSDMLLTITGVAAAFILGAAVWGVSLPNRMPRVVAMLPFVLLLIQLGQFERVREFIRKPYVIGGYMYANGIRVEDYPLLKRDGLLKHATYVSTREIRPDNRVQAGGDVFMLACSRCHTTSGINGLTDKFHTLYPDGDWDVETMVSYMETMHGARPYMPEFPGTREELGALAEYVIALRDNPAWAEGVQDRGLVLPERLTPEQKLGRLEAVISGDRPLADQQEAFTWIANLNSPAADDFFLRWLDGLANHNVPAGLELDLLRAAELRKNPAVQAKRQEVIAQLQAESPLGLHALATHGGHAERGKELFLQKACVSCHQVGDVGGGVGPAVTNFARKRTRAELVESVLQPSAKISEGFETTIVVTAEGLIKQGIVTRETEDELELVAANGDRVVLAHDDIDDRVEGPSLMPEGFAEQLTPEQLRDVIEYLTTLKK